MNRIRWNDGTHIWEIAVNPAIPTTLFNHLPIANPTQPLDTANKQYVDTAVAGVTGFVPYTGATANVNLGAFNLFATKIGVGNVNPLATLHVGSGAVSSIVVAPDILISAPAHGMLSVVDSTNHVEGFFLALTNVVYLGTGTNHNLNFRTNNVDAAQITPTGTFRTLLGFSIQGDLGSSVTGVVNDFNPPGLETASMLVLTPAAALTITGIQAPASGVGKILMMINASGAPITLKVNDPGSLPANRLLLGTAADKLLSLFSTATFRYSGGNWWQIAGTQL